MESKSLNSSNDEQNTEEKQPIRLVDVDVTNENEALRCMVSFLNLAQRRGAFTIDESSKIWECIQIFQNIGKNSETNQDTVAV